MRSGPFGISVPFLDARESRRSRLYSEAWKGRASPLYMGGTVFVNVTWSDSFVPLDPSKAVSAIKR